MSFNLANLGRQSGGRGTPKLPLRAAMLIIYRVGSNGVEAAWRARVNYAVGNSDLAEMDALVG